MTRGFQIWAHNLNRTTFGLLFGQETAKNWILPVFGRFFGKKGSNVVRFKF